MEIVFKARTQAKKLTKETLLLFLKKLDGKHIKALKFDYKEPTKKIFDSANPSEILDMFDYYGDLLFKGKNGLGISINNYSRDGTCYWSGWITVKNLKKIDEITSELIELLNVMSSDEQFLYGSIATREEYDLKHKVTTEWSYGWEGSSILDFYSFFPGIYWCTIFGKAMYQEIGKNKFLNIDNVDYLDFNDETIGFKLKIPIEDLDAASKLETENQITAKIGKEYFFDRNDHSKKAAYPASLKLFLKNLKRTDE